MSPPRHTKLLRNWPLLGVFALGLLLTGLSYLLHERRAHQNIIRQAGEDASEYSRMLQQGAVTYVHLNRDVAGVFAAYGHVTPQKFEAYIRRVEAFETHPGLSYIGYVPRVAMSNAAEFQAMARKSDPSFTIHGSQRDLGFAYPLLHAVPFDEGVRRRIGFDHSAVPERWEAMQKAADLGRSIATQKLKFRASLSQEDFVFIFTPTYDSAKPIDTIAERRVALTGFVFSVFLMDGLIEQVMGGKFKEQFDLEIYDGNLNRDSLLYDGDPQAHSLGEGFLPIAHKETVDFGGRNWALHFHPKPVYSDRFEHANDWMILFSGGLVSLALAFLTLKWQRHRLARRLQLEYGERFRAVFENHPSAVFSLDPHWRFLNANAQAIQQFEISKDKLVGASLSQLIPSENVIRAQEQFNEALSGAAVTYDSTLITGKGRLIEVSIVLIPVNIEGKVSSVLGIAQNITERRQAEWKLQESRQMLQLVIDNIPQRVFWKNTELFFLGCNKAFCEDAGLTDPQHIVGKMDTDLPWKSEADSYQQDDLKTMQSGLAKINYEEPQHRQDGAENWLRTSKIPLTDVDGRTIGVLGMYENITERKRLEQRLEQMAHYDGLTGLPNRAHVYARLEQAIGKVGRDGTLLGLMYFDIDKFKQINDTYGHDVGDAVINLFARRMSSTVRDSDVVGRLGGDEFCLLIENLPGKQAVEILARKLIGAMRPPLQVGQIALQISTSIGIAFHEPGMTADELIRRADHAMYQAKQSGRNRFEMARPDNALSL